MTRSQRLKENAWWRGVVHRNDPNRTDVKYGIRLKKTCKICGDVFYIKLRADVHSYPMPDMPYERYLRIDRNQVFDLIQKYMINERASKSRTRSHIDMHYCSSCGDEYLKENEKGPFRLGRNRIKVVETKVLYNKIQRYGRCKNR